MTMFDVHLESPHIVLSRAINFLFRLVIEGKKCGTRQNLYALPSMNVLTLLIFCFIVVEQTANFLHCFMTFIAVIRVFIFHFNDRATYILRYLAIWFNLIKPR